MNKEVGCIDPPRSWPPQPGPWNCEEEEEAVEAQL